MQGILSILTLFLAPFSLSIPIKSFICPGFMFIQQALLISNDDARDELTSRSTSVETATFNTRLPESFGSNVAPK
jgi:hypothetical protein